MDSHRVTRALFGGDRALVGMIHVGALPGTPRASLPLEAIVEAAVAEACVYRDAGFHAVAIENMHDRPYLARAVGPEVVAAMAVVGREVRRAAGLPLGVQILAGANHAALAVALCADAAFVRVEGFVFAHVADEGPMASDAGELLRYRRSIGAEGIRVFADVKKKHSSHAVTADVDIVETARAAEFFLADGVIVTGAATGQAADAAELRAVAGAVSIPVLVGSGVTPENVAGYADADAFIVGSALKQGGLWSNPIDPARVQALRRAFDALPGR
jgi:hypothetical protein